MNLLVHLLTQHDDTVRIKAYHADVTKKRVPGLQMSNPPARRFRRPLVLPQGAPQWELNPFPSRFLYRAAPTGGFALPPDPSHLGVFLRGTIFLGNVSLWGKKTSWIYFYSVVRDWYVETNRTLEPTWLISLDNLFNGTWTWKIQFSNVWRLTVTERKKTARSENFHG